MTTSALEAVLGVLHGFEAKDVEAVVGRFAARGVFSDPHYPPPIGPTMTGHDAIRQGLAWALGILEQPGFTVRHKLWSPERPRVAAVEVDTDHRMMGGATLRFPQVFVAELGDDGLLLRLQSYAPHPPPAV
jgi:hypothetical protein